MKVVGIIPARYESSRLPNKLLLKIAGKTLIERVYEQVSKAQKLDEVVVATDNEQIAQLVEQFGGNCLMTSAEHLCGTDRCAEAATILGNRFDFVVNIQGDEPFIEPQQIDDLVAQLTNDTEILTHKRAIHTLDQLCKNSLVKVVTNAHDYAIYFSRQPIPFIRDKPMSEWLSITTFWEHVGIYAFRKDILQKIATLEPTHNEQLEKIELLRWVENDLKIKILATNYQSISIDTPEDFELACSLIEAAGKPELARSSKFV